MAENYLAIGLMSGTSLDGIDAALLRTDGIQILETGAYITHPYEEDFKDRLRNILGAESRTATINELERMLTDHHNEVVQKLLALADISSADVDLIGFHGQTIHHRPDLQWTWQLGLGERLAALSGIDVVYDFRSNDVAAGGQGAPLAPVYHRALARGLEMPVAILNLGGVGNITFLSRHEDAPIAFDTGPANALLDDWIRGSACEALFDMDGQISRAGTVHEAILARLLDHPFFTKPYPKSLDRDAFDPAPLSVLSIEDGAATLAAFTAGSVARGISLLPQTPRRLLVTGGGRHNPTIMNGLAQRLECPVEPVEAAGWHGDALEAQAFAFMAVRHKLGLPISFPKTTGIAHPMTGGKRAYAPRRLSR